MTPPRRLLLVDDEDDIREVAQASIEMMTEWEVRTAATGEEAVSQAREHRPDAILLDVMMPGMDGPTTIARLREIPETRDIPVVLLTAKVHAGDQQRLSAAGAVGVLAKPFDPLTLADQVRAMLGWPA